MPETRQITFAYQELAEMLVKQQGIHEGLWGIYFELGIGEEIYLARMETLVLLPSFRSNEWASKDLRKKSRA